ncbi:hypothetical protein ACJX0J_016506, partial [Zea mays]
RWLGSEIVGNGILLKWTLKPNVLFHLGFLDSDFGQSLYLDTHFSIEDKHKEINYSIYHHSTSLSQQKVIIQDAIQCAKFYKHMVFIYTIISKIVETNS